MEKLYTTDIPRLKDVNRSRTLRNRAIRQARYEAEGTHSGRVTRFYQSPAWKGTRDVYLRTHPIDQLCILDEHVVSAQCVHHVIKFAEQPTEELCWRLFLDTDNLLSLSAHTHECVHYNPKELTEEQRAYIEERKRKIFEKYLNEGLAISVPDDSNVL